MDVEVQMSDNRSDEEHLDDVIEGQSPPGQDDDLQMSALQDSIRRKGSNSYYYAHGLKADGPKWDGNEVPRLLKTEISPVLVPTRPQVSFPSYAWADGRKSIKIYIELEPNLTVTIEDIILEWTETSIDLKVRAPSQDYVFSMAGLFGAINDATFCKKESKVTITATKVKEFSWYKLTADTK
eukprot:gene8126-16680_t